MPYLLIHIYNKENEMSEYNFLDTISNDYSMLEEFASKPNESPENLAQATADYEVINKMLATASTLVEKLEDIEADRSSIKDFQTLKDRLELRKENIEGLYPELSNVEEFDLDDFEEPVYNKETTNNSFDFDFQSVSNVVEEFEEEKPKIKKESIKETIQIEDTKKPVFISNVEQAETFYHLKKITDFGISELTKDDFSKIKIRSDFEIKDDEERATFLKLHLSGKIRAFEETESLKDIKSEMEMQFHVLKNSGKLRSIAEMTFKDSEANDNAERRMAFLDAVSSTKEYRTIEIMKNSSFNKRPVIPESIKNENIESTFESLSKNKIDYDASLIYTKKLFFNDTNKAELYKDIYDNRDELKSFALAYSVSMHDAFKDPDVFYFNIKRFEGESLNTNDADKKYRDMFIELVKSGRLDYNNLEQKYATLDKSYIQEVHDKSKESKNFIFANMLFNYAASHAETGSDFKETIFADYFSDPIFTSNEIKNHILGEDKSLEAGFDLDVSLPKDKKEIVFQDKLEKAINEENDNKNDDVKEEKTEDIEEVQSNNAPSIIAGYKYNELFRGRINTIKSDGLKRKVMFKDNAWIIESAGSIKAKASNNKKESIYQIASDIVDVAKEKGWESIEINKITRATEDLYVLAIQKGLKVIPKDKEQEQLFNHYHRVHALPGLPGTGAKVEDDLLGIVKVPEERYIRDQNLAKTDANKLHVPATKLRM